MKKEKYTLGYLYDTLCNAEYCAGKIGSEVYNKIKDIREKVSDKVLEAHSKNIDISYEDNKFSALGHKFNETFYDTFNLICTKFNLKDKVAGYCLDTAMNSLKEKYSTANIKNDIKSSINYFKNFVKQNLFNKELNREERACKYALEYPENKISKNDIDKVYLDIVDKESNILRKEISSKIIEYLKAHLNDYLTTNSEGQVYCNIKSLENDIYNKLYDEYKDNIIED